MHLYSDIIKNSQISTTEKSLLLTLVELDGDKSLIELSNMLNITKPTLVKSLKSLEEKNLIQITNDGGRYCKNRYLINKCE